MSACTPSEKYQAELAAHVLLYVQRVTDDPATLRTIGVTRELALNLHDLSLRDLMRLGHHTRQTVLDSLCFDHACLQALLDAATRTIQAPCGGWQSISEPHTALVEHLLLMAVRTLDEGGYPRSIGLTIEEIDHLWSLTPAQLRWIASSRAHFVDVHIDPGRLRTLLDQIERSHEEEALQAELLRARAPSALMQSLFGWTTADFAERRRLLRLKWTGRAPAFHNESVAWEAEDLWRKLERARHPLPLSQRYLQVARQLEVGIDSIWQMVSRLPEQASPPIRRRPRASCPAGN